MCWCKTKFLAKPHLLFGDRLVMYCFKRIEKFAKKKYPNFIKNILVKFGFDCEAALELISEEEIEIIEKKINDNLDEYKIYLKNSPYETLDETDNGVFKFRLGHRAIILDIRSKLDACNKEKNTNKLNKKNSKKIPNLSDKKFIEKLSKKIINYYTNKDLPNASSFYFSSNKLQEKLNKKEHTFVKSETHVKYKIKCPFCEKKIVCNFYEYSKTCQ